MTRYFFGVRMLWLAIGSFFLVSACSPLPPQRPAINVEEAHAFGSTQVEFSPAGKLLASGGLGGDIKIWSVPSMERRMVLKVHVTAVRALAWLNETLLVSGGDDGRVVVWDLAREDPRQIRVGLLDASVVGLAFLPESKGLACATRDGFVRVLELTSLRTLRKRHLGSRILALRGHSRGAPLAVSVRGKKICLLDGDLQVLEWLPSPDREIHSLAFAPDRGQLAGGGWFKIFLWDLSGGGVERLDTGHFGKIPSLDYSPDGRLIASIGRVSDSSIFLIRSDTGGPSRRLLRHSLCGTSLRFSPDGRYIASTSDDKSLRLYDLSETYPPP